MSIVIHGKEYITVAERVAEAHKDQAELSIETEILPNENSIVFKATVKTSKGIFVGHSAPNPNKLIEKENPHEVAETSAIGRALGFAGYGIVEDIASADEMIVATRTPQKALDRMFTPGQDNDFAPTDLGKCRKCGANMVKNPKTNKLFCENKCWLGESK